ncbi:MAG TPA: glycogen/starch synthase [bacterium]|nr:glycogen/starch synthase [bacterium]HPV65530.1 glycogen/starch synthase [bacterium]
MDKKKIKIIHVSAEVAPFSKTGGLADVARSLPEALFKLDHDVRIITPFYGKLIDEREYNLKMIFKNINVVIDPENSIKVNFWQGKLNGGLPVYFVDIKKYFSKHKRIYGSDKENVRFLTFNVAVLKLLNILELVPDIIHCHDWHSGLIPYFLKNKGRYTKIFSKTKTVFTIHNLAFQMGRNWFHIPPEKKDYGRKKIPLVSDPEIENVNFAKRAIMSADIINAVSEKYRDEIMTKKFGQDLHRILKNRSNRLFGIVNGIDYDSYNPQNDPGLFHKFDFKTHKLKKENKKFLQKKLGLPVNENVPLICSTSRIAHQKGFDVVLKLLPFLSRLDIQIIFMGDGSENYIKEIKNLNKKFPKKIFWMPFRENHDIETLVYAGSDFFVLPSYYEPCGINQMISMRYGCIPIVRETGGLYDTVKNFNPGSKNGTGFTFRYEDEFSFFWAIVRALETYKYKDVWNSIIERAMSQSSSWEIPAQKYVKLYKKAIKIKD